MKPISDMSARTLSYLQRIVLLLLIATLYSCESSELIATQSSKAHHTKDGFQNLYIEDSNKDFFDFLKMRFLGDEEWADHAEFADDVPIQDVDLAKVNNPGPDLQITWLGHSMFLIQYQKLNILTDPIFTDRASPIPFAGPKRYVDHAMDYANLPDIDMVIISHNHYDHLDVKTLEQLSEKSTKQPKPIHFYVPLGVQSLLVNSKVQAQNISEMDWWDSSKSSHGYTIQALPSQHWSARGATDRRKTLWASWALKINERTIWFAGDTGYNNVQFKQIGEHLKAVDLALIPIGAYEPRWFMQQYHVNPKEALLIHKDVNSQASIGMHWGTFPLTAEMPLAPVSELENQRNVKGIEKADFDVMAIGETRALKFD